MESIIKLPRSEYYDKHGKLDIFKKYRNCFSITDGQGTDFSFYMQGGSTENDKFYSKSEDGFSYWIDNDNSGENFELHGLGNRRYNYTPDGYNISTVYLATCKEKRIGIRPFIHYVKGAKPILIKDDLYAYGEYINEKVPMKMRINLEEMYEAKDKKLSKTGKHYHINDKEFNEYYYNNKKYVRLDLFDEVVWFEVKPLVCVYSEDADAYMTKDVIISGIPYDNTSEKELVKYKDSDICKFLNKTLAKDLVPSEPLLSTKDLDLSDYDYNRVLRRSDANVSSSDTIVYFVEGAEEIIKKEEEEKNRLDAVVRHEVESNAILPPFGRRFKDLSKLFKKQK